MIGRRLTEREQAEYDAVAPGRMGTVRVVRCSVLPPRASAMTLGTVIFMRPSANDDAVLLAHELVHVRQWDELGLIGFLHRYLSDYLRNLIRLRRHRPAYLAIPLEAAARAEARAWRDGRADR